MSVIIPTYNRASVLSRAIDCVLAQTHPEVELIVVDDGSSDNTAEVLARFGDRITYIRQENRGVSAARNVGMVAAKGDWVAFLDSDDEWHPTKIAKQLECLQSSGFKACYTRCLAENKEPIRDIDELKPSIGKPITHYFAQALDLMASVQLHPQIQSLMADRLLVRRAGMFDESLYAAEDTRLIYNLAFLSGFAYIDEPLVVIHRGSVNSLTSNTNPEAARKRLSSYARVQAEMFWRMLERDPGKAVIFRRRFSYFISRRAELACVARQFDLARIAAKNALGFSGDMKTFIRCLGIYLFPRLLHGRFKKKWSQEEVV